MKNLLLGWLFRWLGKKLDGHKTQIGGIGSILLGILGILGIMFPDIKVVDYSLEMSLGFIAAGFAALGIGGKLEKVKGVEEEIKVKLTQQNNLGGH